MMKQKNKHLTEGNTILEIGSGGGFIKEIYPFIITSDVRESDADIVVNAEHLPFEDEQLGAIFALHCIHHIPNIELFFNEALRVLKPGGGIVCVEPYWSPVARYLYKKHHPEPFDENAKGWILADPSGPMSGSNQALSYILLKRDKNRFASEFPRFKSIRGKRFGFIRYFCTGGLWKKQKLPDFFFPIMKVLEVVLTPLMPLFAIHHLFIIKKTER